jgi:hypothetical protein
LPQKSGVSCGGILGTRASRHLIHITDRMTSPIRSMGMGEPSDWSLVDSVGNQVSQDKTLVRLKKYGLAAAKRV